MSVTTQLPSHPPQKSHKNSSSHLRNDSEELDVFEAARYFSGTNEHPYSSYNTNASKFSQSYKREDRRMSLDIPIMRPPQNYTSSDQKKNTSKDQTKKFKQPSSPGGKLASFLNALFNQTSSKKKKSKSLIGSKNFEEEEESPGGRRRRRSSISHFSITSNNEYKSSFPYSSSTIAGLRTPPPYAETPKKAYNAFSNFTYNKKKVQVSHVSYENGLQQNPLKKELIYAKKGEDYEWLRDDHVKFSSHKIMKNDGDFNSGPIHFDDGAESDSSSDLFDLPNHELDFYPNGLPVYETTHTDRIQNAAPISGTAAKSLFLY